MEICKLILVKKSGDKISKIKFNYIFSVDTIQGVINELAKIIDLNNLYHLVDILFVHKN